MKFQDACNLAIRISKENVGCAIHVNGTIKLDRYDAPIIDPNGWHQSDWYAAGCTVRTYINGKVHE